MGEQIVTAVFDVEQVAIVKQRCENAQKAGVITSYAEQYDPVTGQAVYSIRFPREE
jgi:hypothetical protein